MALNVINKTALVTGAGSGICLEFTKLLLSRNCNVLIADLSLRPESEELVKDHSSKEPDKARAVFVKTDVTDWIQLQNAFDVAIKEFGTLDIVCPGAGIFEPESSSFWHIQKSLDTPSTSSYKTLDLNITHPIRATQLAIDTFMRQKSGHGVVILISSIAAQMPLLPIPLYSTSKAAISHFTRSLAHLEGTLGVRVCAVAPGCVKTPIWTEDKLAWVDEEKDTWVSQEKVAEVMLKMIEEKEHVGGTVLEIGVDKLRQVELLGDEGPKGRGFTVANIGDGYAAVYGIIGEEYGK